MLQEYCKNILCSKHILWDHNSVWCTSAWCEFLFIIFPLEIYICSLNCSHLLHECKYGWLVECLHFSHFCQLEQKQKYAVWKAADIRKALKEGRKPNPGPPADDENLSIPSSTPSGGYVRFEYQQYHSLNLVCWNVTSFFPPEFIQNLKVLNKMGVGI